MAVRLTKDDLGRLGYAEGTTVAEAQKQADAAIARSADLAKWFRAARTGTAKK